MESGGRMMYEDDIIRKDDNGNVMKNEATLFLSTRLTLGGEFASDEMDRIITKGLRGNKYEPHQGKKECLRRLKRLTK